MFDVLPHRKSSCSSLGHLSCRALARIWTALAGILLVSALSSLSGCSSAEDDAAQSQDAKNGQVHVALIMKSLANEFFINMAEGARHHQADSEGAYKLTVNGIKNEVDLAQQVSLVEQMIANRVDIIVIAPANSKSLIPVLKRAQQQGIVVVNIDNQLDRDILKAEGLSIPFIGPDNREGARKAGLYAAEKLTAGDQVAILGGISGAFNAEQRALGFKDAIASAGLKLVSEQSADWEQAKAATLATALINEFPDLDAIFAANDNMALGAIAARRQAGKKDIKIVGFDNIAAANELVKSGEMLATVDQYGDKLAVYGIEYALSVKNGERVEDRKTPVDLVIAKQ